ncbi:PREDICTED: LOW QUALITY PROTEIN: probable protein phosphatase 2C 65 [Theobroma cacao]|uniref:LOW QUALITY PROTEIN: probable protein phosphatase 2C 65 n=1 Tax=Theobroma cacao TaxID=3641 RepID=A0AB32WAM4_THECC|nr:PREDICTED: LOW QUALITY PROTEIN: probable protein phosphatase 2C 65 [Theobroma cacao]
MGACCSTQIKYNGCRPHEHDLEEIEDRVAHEDGDTTIRRDGAIVRFQGSSSYTSMYTRQGKKGVNQDAMTVWENFMGEKNVFFCGVFDGHGASGHRIARYICDTLPLKLSSVIRASQPDACQENVDAVAVGQNHGKDDSTGVNKDSDKEDSNHNEILSSWEASLIQAFGEVDEDLMLEESLDSYCSGTTAVIIVKQAEHLIVSNLGDSRAVLCTRDDTNQLVPVQLTVDLKPSIPSEAERIQRYGGRVFAMDEEPNVQRVWMPNQDYPGLAMARAFGDFCLKDHGLSSIPQVSYRRLTSKDEFVVLATDGVWDVLTNNEVIRIVASVKKRSIAAKLLVYYAVQTWRTKYPGSKVDDCAVVCLFLKKRPFVSRSFSDMRQHTGSHLDVTDSSISKDKKTDEGETVINCSITMDPKALDKLNRVNTYMKRSRLGSQSRRILVQDFGGTEAKW